MRGIVFQLCLLAVCTTTIFALPQDGFRMARKELDLLEDEVVCDEGVEFIPHHDCTKYYICDNDMPIAQNCAVPLYFNPRRNICSFPDEVPECVGGTRPPTGTSPHTQKPTERPTEATTNLPTRPSTQHPTQQPTQIPTEKPTEAPGICKEDGIYNLPVPNNCSAYIQCVYGLAIPSVCAEGLLFDPVLLKCNLKELVKCEGVTEPPTTPKPICEDADSVYNVLFPGNCSLYYICAYGRPILESCATNTIFDPEVGKCVREMDYDCPYIPSHPPAPTTSHPPETTTVNKFQCPNIPHIFLPHPDDCGLFYKCRDGEFNGIFSCGDDLWFDSELQSCVLPAESNCSVETVIKY